jgi:predicted site-specific integrase-resolvase
MIEYLSLLKPFFELRGKVNINEIDVETVDDYVIIYVRTSNTDQAELLADAIDQVKNKILEVIRK